MSWRFRRRWSLLPGLHLNFSKRGLSSITVGGRGASFNIPIERKGGPRSTVGLPGTGLSYSVDHDRNEPELPAPSKGFETKATHEDILEESLRIQRDAWLGPTGLGDLFWKQHGVGLVKHLIDRPDTPREILEQCQLVLSFDRIEVILRRAPDAETVAALGVAITDAARAIHDYGVSRGMVEI